jgi:peroxiredoxin
MRALWRVLGIATLVFAAVFESVGATAAEPVRLQAGMQAPLFARADLKGNTVDLKALRGQIVLLDFWASWCAPCIVEIPHLIDLQKRFGSQGLRVIGVSMDDTAAPVKSLQERFAFNYPLLMGDAKFGNLYGGVLGLPVRFLISRDGKIIRIWRGEVPADTVEKALKAALKGSWGNRFRKTVPARE